MTMNSDFTISILAEQHRADLIAEAAQDHLAKLARADRTPTWRRLLGRLHRGSDMHRSQPLATGQHRVAH
jgi:hypothetical protein